MRRISNKPKVLTYQLQAHQEIKITLMNIKNDDNNINMLKKNSVACTMASRSSPMASCRPRYEALIPKTLRLVLWETAIPICIRQWLRGVGDNGKREAKQLYYIHSKFCNS